MIEKSVTVLIVVLLAILYEVRNKNSYVVYHKYSVEQSVTVLIGCVTSYELARIHNIC